MKFEETGFEGLITLAPDVFDDKRGCFYEAYNQKTFEKIGIDDHFVQDNHSFSKYGVLRGLHFQRPPFAQSKLVKVLRGIILDAVVDLRSDSKTLGQHYKIELSDKNKKQLYVPKGFAHGFIVLSESAEVMYKCDAFYSKQSEGGLIYNDPSLKIDWIVKSEDIILSDKDSLLPSLEEIELF